MIIFNYTVFFFLLLRNNIVILLEFQNQVEQSLDNTTSILTEEEAHSHNHAEEDSSSVPKLETENPLKAAGRSSRKYFCMSVCILLLSASATYFFDKKSYFNLFNG